MDRHLFVGVGGVVGSAGPAEEAHAGVHITGARGVDKGLEVVAAVNGVGALHQHADGIRHGIVLMLRGQKALVLSAVRVVVWVVGPYEHHHQPAIVGVAHHIDGEVLGSEGHGVVHGNHGGDVFAFFRTFVEDVETLPVPEIRVGDGHLRGLAVSRLPLLAVVHEGDVIRGQHGAAVHIHTLHGDSG